MEKKILIPLPAYGFDPTESSVPWNYLHRNGHKVTFATPDGQPARADIRMVTGVDLPKLLVKSLMATPEAVELYKKMLASIEFQNPISYATISDSDFHAILLVGGHDKGMRLYLESQKLHSVIASFFSDNRPVAAICHGTLLAARSLTSNKKSVLFGRKTTGLTKNQEMIAYNLTRLWLKDYYRTYKMPMADEVISFLKSPSDYDPGPGYPIPLKRDSEKNLSPSFIVRDRNYLSARWPGDAHKFASEFIRLLAE